MSRTSEIGLSRKQKVFVTLESVMGTFTFPNATTDGIRSVQNSVLNQNPAFVNSEELADTLDVLDQFQNATPAGTFTLKMYVRPSGTVGGAPQGDVLFRCMQGSVNGGTGGTLASASLSTAISSSIATISVGTITGYFPKVGVITVGTEKIYYTGKTQIAGGTTATFTGCTRGYGATTATAHLISVATNLTSRFYKQETTSESFTLWIESDHFVQALSGCSVNNATIDLNNEGGLTLTFSGEGMQMKWAGKDALATNATAGALSITITDAKRFCDGMYIYNVTKASGKKLISSTNATTNVIVISTATGAAWATNDVIKGYLPTMTEIGDPIESKEANVYLDGTETRLRTGTLNMGVPKKYLTDEIGAEFPEDYLEDVRDINITMNLYFRRANAKWFTDGYTGNEVSVRMVFGEEAGSIMEIYQPRVKLQVPEINFDPPAMALSIPAKALGTGGEDSMEIIFR